MPEQPELWAALLPVVDVLKSLDVAYYIGGSVASSYAGVARATQDADLVDKRFHRGLRRLQSDDTLPSGPREKTIAYQAPWIRCDRERDYEVVWKHFEERFERVPPPHD